ncbi:MAG: xanthine dehydrogenase family protein subunit M [Gemmatimonadales bacterium]
MIPVGFEYERASSLREVMNALAKDDGTKLIAGGHSLLPMLRFRLAQPAKLLDIGGVQELKGIDATGRKTKIGSLVTYRELIESAEIAQRFPIIIEAALGIGDLQVRNLGTVGGGIAHADPASDMPALMLALSADLTLRSKGGKRSVPANEFFQGPFATAMRPDEVLAEIVLPPLPKGAGAAYVSIEQQASGYAMAGAAAVVTRSRKTVKTAVVALTGVSDCAYLADVSGVVGTHADQAALEAATARVTAGRDVNNDIHASSEYRAHLAGVVARRAIATAYGRAG